MIYVPIHPSLCPYHSWLYTPLIDQYYINAQNQKSNHEKTLSLKDLWLFDTPFFLLGLPTSVQRTLDDWNSWSLSSVIPSINGLV